MTLLTIPAADPDAYGYHDAQRPPKQPAQPYVTIGGPCAHFAITANSRHYLCALAGHVRPRSTPVHSWIEDECFCDLHGEYLGPPTTEVLREVTRNPKSAPPALRPAWPEEPTRHICDYEHCGPSCPHWPYGGNYAEYGGISAETALAAFVFVAIWATVFCVSLDWLLR